MRAGRYHAFQNRSVAMASGSAKQRARAFQAAAIKRSCLGFLDDKKLQSAQAVSDQEKLSPSGTGEAILQKKSLAHHPGR